MSISGRNVYVNFLIRPMNKNWNNFAQNCSLLVSSEGRTLFFRHWNIRRWEEKENRVGKLKIPLVNFYLSCDEDERHGV